jgi:uncharacterized secreted repeat protein (TIGR03808 family)
MKIPRRALISAPILLAKSSSTKAAGAFNLRSALAKAKAEGGVLNVPPGRHEADDLLIDFPLQLVGVPGQSVLTTQGGAPILTVQNCADVSVSGVSFEGVIKPMTDALPALVVGWKVERLTVEACRFSNSGRTGLKIEECSGVVKDCHFHAIKDAALIAVNSYGLMISNNAVDDVGNNGIQVWRHKLEEDGTQVIGNRVSNVRSEAGGDGPNGNGISVFNAGSVIIANNRVTDTVYSCIRCNSGSNVQIIGNSMARSQETALYVEFNFQGAVVANNIIEDAAHGISITNLDVGGRMATCTANLVRGLRGSKTTAATDGVGIHCEAETIVSNNVIEDAETIGINLGWADACRNITAQGNVIRNCGQGIGFSVSDGAKDVLIAGNIIAKVSKGAIVGMKGDQQATGDFLKDEKKVPAHVHMYGNVVTE